MLNQSAEKEDDVQPQKLRFYDELTNEEIVLDEPIRHEIAVANEHSGERTGLASPSMYFPLDQYFSNY
jgi:hypothetical protein